MNAIPSISSQIDEKLIFKVIDKHFSRLAPHYYKWISSWLIGAYENYVDIDKYIILIYIINKDFIFFKRNGLIIDYDTFYKDKSLEVDKINISDISKDLQIPKETVRRKVEELEKADVIKKKGKKIFITRTAFTTAQATFTLKNMSTVLCEFNKILEEEKIVKIVYQSTEISDSIKKNFSFVWYQFYKFIFIFTNRWRKELGDLETFTIGVIVLINAVENKNFKVKKFDRKKYSISIQGSDERGVNAMSLAEITGIPRSTVIRKLKSLIKKDLFQINEKNLITVNMRGESFKMFQRLQYQNIISLSNFISRTFNHLKITN
ncbi:MarR family transcriptional regulator [Candidatus Pelagibacter ubique]|nr:MarR family transcriptional regulator [Candidatus Pelagibacter ubique]MDA7456768.1 MarR family transcriptional regulator [Candidatus Pelagibacter ubique]MDA7479094.1 MarR family transcriptional regulator [Candidatus Pelagibacter ubique]MDC3355939.1 MarR family transcriptional regulator [Candidatus Pelagibacter ubique]